MPSATVVSLKARSYQISHLCFPVHGIVESLGQVAHFRQPIRGGPIETFAPIQLGDQVTPFDFTKFYVGLSTTSKADPSLLIYNSLGILNDLNVQNSLLMTLRAEPMAAVLDKAINARQNAYYAKYANLSGPHGIISVMQQLYKATTPPVSFRSKLDALAQLSTLSGIQYNDLESAYNVQPLPTVPTLPNVVSGTSSQLTTTGSFPDTTQNITNTDFAYRTPAYEAQAQFLRAQISLNDQQFSAFMAGQNLLQLPQVFKNELQGGIDLDVKRLQIAYLNTILMSPISGVITGIYKNPGDWVQAGEPVIRVEDNSSVILVGTLRYQGLISIGSELTVTTSPFDSSGVPPSVKASVIAVRGHPNQDDLWEVHAIYQPASTSLPPLPPNYTFDYDNTSVTIS
jgi:HlyD family secretion protein